MKELPLLKNMLLTEIAGHLTLTDEMAQELSAFLLGGFTLIAKGTFEETELIALSLLPLLHKPAATGSWIFVDAALPSEDGLYLVTVDLRDGPYTEVAGYSTHKGWSLMWGLTVGLVVAWMPMPEPARRVEATPE